MPASPVLNARLVRARDSNTIPSNTDVQVNVCSLKRSREDVARNPGGVAAKKAKRSKKTARNGADCNGSDCADDKPRVGCPYYKKDGTLKQASCNGKGWPDPGKMKDHLKSVHKMSLKWLNEHIHFKEKPYFGEPIGVQWKLAFCRLFPDVPKDEVPSPYINDVQPPSRTAIANKDLEALGAIMKHKLLDYYRIELLCELPVQGLETVFTNTFADAVADWKDGAPPPTSPTEHDLMRIWSQAENSRRTISLTPMEPSPSPAHDELPLRSCDALSMNPIIKLEECDDEFSDAERWTCDRDLDVKPTLTLTLYESDDQKVQVNSSPKTSALSKIDHTSTPEEPSVPVMMPFGQEYPFSETHASELDQSCPGQSTLETEPYLEDPFMGPELSFSSDLMHFSSLAPALPMVSLGEDESGSVVFNFDDWLSSHTSESYDDENGSTDNHQ